MDGYVIARLAPGEAEDIFALPQVRHVAELADGNTFVAFDGELPYLGGMVLESIPAHDFFPLLPKIRRVAPIPDEPEYFALYSGAVFSFMPFVPRMQVALIACDLVLACTPTPPPGAPIWSSRSERIRDKRLELVIV